MQSIQYWAFSVWPVFGVPVRVHYSYLILLQVEVFASFLVYVNFTFTLLIFLIYGPILFGTLVLVSLKQESFVMQRSFAL